MSMPARRWELGSPVIVRGGAPADWPSAACARLVALDPPNNRAARGRIVRNRVRTTLALQDPEKIGRGHARRTLKLSEYPPGTGRQSTGKIMLNGKISAAVQVGRKRPNCDRPGQPRATFTHGREDGRSVGAGSPS